MKCQIDGAYWSSSTHAEMEGLWRGVDQFSSVQSLSRVRLFATPWIAARQASLSITNSWSSLRLTSIESVMPSSHLILCCPLLLLPPIPPSIRVFSNESALRMRWPKYWSFSFSIIPSTGDVQTQFCLSLCGVPGSWCAWGLFEPSECLWWEWGLILNVNLCLLSSYWGFSDLGHGKSPQCCQILL